MSQPILERPERAWAAAERAVLRRLSSPERVQAWLDELPYRAEESTACPRTVLRERLANSCGWTHAR